ncbi:hypothetical protein S140_153 [Shewanella sp. phage 1/40]|uniref:hypothetical protein n=1 Tax=Shewanella sp. phage 1/40 TaxID=1458860 RepID=UPI0004F8C01A|nr:hypothetical protein S140_153 [Shewanella sp. phage 1/40]AHK11560.1 hypothetical protein S140_153 [Shewanella sp. phage 1/40]
MSWEFNHNKVMFVLAEIIEGIVGDSLADLPNSGGVKAVYLANYGGIEPPLPHVLLTYQGSNDNDGYSMAEGFVDVEVDNPLDPPNKITLTTTYVDSVVNFNITLTAESLPPAYSPTFERDNGNAFSILRDIRKGLLLPKNRRRLHTEVFTAIELINTIKSTPDLVSTEYHDIGTMVIKLSSVDRSIDYDCFTFDTLDWVGEIKIDETDPDPIILTGSVTFPPLP